MGPQSAQSFSRLFFAPGVNHCGGGAGPNSFDMLAVLEDWAERDIAPERIVAAKYRDNDMRQPLVRTRPLCAYPAVARWDGLGDVNREESFICATTGGSAATIRVSK
ncbi:MAG: tannase/feruloyl esterase family alpha/beta hydrolase [Spongiibacteraceae bacterium]|nr:tannase/feruloyl esterase family alpha/beta hydrolase [Spongiibacteraceae bacterium]